MHCFSVPNCTTNSRSPAMDPPSDRLGYATLRRTSSPEHFVNLSKLDREIKPNGLIIMNSPMFGNDPIFGTVFQQDRPQWQQIADNNFFRHWPCDPKGWPMHGHM